MPTAPALTSSRPDVEDSTSPVSLTAPVLKLPVATRSTTLLLGWNSVHGARATAVLEALRYNRHITHLDLSWNTVGSKGACSLGWSLRFNKALTHLDLTHNDVGERGGFVLADTLQENTTLTTLRLDKNPLGGCGATALLRALHAYACLGCDRLISMVECNFEATEIADIEERRTCPICSKRKQPTVCNLALNEEPCFLHDRSFDPKEPQGKWICRLDDPYGRAVANGLAAGVEVQ